MCHFCIGRSSVGPHRIFPGAVHVVFSLHSNKWPSGLNGLSMKRPVESEPRGITWLYVRVNIVVICLVYFPRLIPLFAFCVDSGACVEYLSYCMVSGGPVVRQAAALEYFIYLHRRHLIGEYRPGHKHCRFLRRWDKGGFYWLRLRLGLALFPRLPGFQVRLHSHGHRTSLVRFRLDRHKAVILHHHVPLLLADGDGTGPGVSLGSRVGPRGVGLVLQVIDHACTAFPTAQ